MQYIWASYVFLLSVELGELPETKTAAALFQQLCYHNKNHLMAGIIVAGWDPRNGGTVYNIPLGGSLVRQPFAIGGSGSTYIFGYCDSTFRKGMTRKECEDFVVYGTYYPTSMFFCLLICCFSIITCDGP
jgi:20S proteasome subunit beta 1